MNHILALKLFYNIPVSRQTYYYRMVNKIQFFPDIVSSKTYQKKKNKNG